jgi:mxaL protein
VPVDRAVFRYLFVVDITRSMNARDYDLPGEAHDRLGFVKEAIRRVLFDLPCGSEVGLGLFTTRNAEILFDPIEVCEHLPIIADVLTHIDWRMAWGGDSFIAEGLFNALRQLRSRSAPICLAFFTDGQQTPEDLVQPRFTGKPGEVKGAIVGVGGTQPVLIPKFDQENRLLGYWESSDVRKPLATSAYREKPFGEAAAANPPTQGYYLSRLYEDRLKRLAATTGLDYHRLQDAESLSRMLRSRKFARERRVSEDLSPGLALAAWGLLLLSWFPPSVLTERGAIRKRSL